MEQEKSKAVPIKEELQDAILLDATHALPDATEEDQQHDDDIMNDDSIWNK